MSNSNFEGLFIMVDFKASFKRQVVLWLRIAFPNAVVRGDDHSLRSDQHERALDGCLERMMIRPLFDEMSTDLFRTHLFVDDCFFVLVAIPPAGIGLDECIRPFRSY